MSKEVRCESCGCRAQYWLGYACPRCGAHNDRLYRSEHADPARARRMTPAMIQREYREAGLSPVAVMMGAGGKVRR